MLYSNPPAQPPNSLYSALSLVVYDRWSCTILTSRRLPARPLEALGVDQWPPRPSFTPASGPSSRCYDIDVAGAALRIARGGDAAGQRAICVAASTSKPYLYVVSSNGGPGGLAGDTHLASAFRIDPPFGRACSRTASRGRCRRARSTPASTDAGGYLLTAYNGPSNVTVHRINARRHARRGGAPAGQARCRHLRPSGPHDAIEPDGDLCGARQQCRRRQARGSRRAQGLSASRTAC